MQQNRGWKISRRGLIRRAAAGLLTLWAPALTATGRQLTPRQTAGPFYPEQLPFDSDNDLVRIDKGPSAEGIAVHLSGQVLSADGEPLPGILVEIWQCDARGRYHHQGDQQSRPRDPNFQGFGRTLSDAKGRYRFRTIRPVAYPGRAPHIHFRLSGAAIETLTTQLYVKGEPANSADWLFQQLGDRADQLVAEFAPSTRADAQLEARWNLVVAARSQA